MYNRIEVIKFTNVYNKLITKTSIKRSVMRMILTKIQSHIKLIVKVHPSDVYPPLS
ncbi:MAG: hypothetical protein ACTS4X_00340 [Candidatus Hodgkinia cicadicola]